jgi:hypothetical protein
MPVYGSIDAEYARRLATCPPDADGPVWMVNFMRYRAKAQYRSGQGDDVSGREADDRYAPVEILADLGAAVVFFGDVEAGGEWDRVGIVRYPTRRSFVAMQSRPDFQEKHVHKAAGMVRTIVCGTLPETPPDPTHAAGGRVLFELVAPGTTRQVAGAGCLRVEGTIIGDGRRFAELGVAWIPDGAAVPATGHDRLVAVVARPSIDTLAHELGGRP